LLSLESISNHRRLPLTLLLLLLLLFLVDTANGLMIVVLVVENIEQLELILE
jgi:hypothetical protein